MVKFIAIENSYSENASYRYDNVNEETYVSYLNSIPQIYSRFESDGTTKELLTKNCTFFEVLGHNNTLKFYFDIENVTNENTIYDIIACFKEFMKLTYSVEFTDYVLTLNSNSSHHAGYSYHLIFNHFSNYMYYMSNIVARFIDYAKNKGVDWINYIDTSVYSKVRLFRSVNQVGITKVGGKAPESDKHVLVEGTVEDSIIQNVSKCKNLYIKELGYKLKQTKFINSNQSSNFKDIIAEAVKQTIKQLMDNQTNLLNPITKPTENDITIKSVTLHKPKVSVRVKSETEVKCSDLSNSTIQPLKPIDVISNSTIQPLKPLEPLKPLKPINIVSNPTIKEPTDSQLTNKTFDMSSIPRLAPLPKQCTNELSYDDKLFTRVFILLMDEKLNGMKLDYVKELVEYYKSHQSFSGYWMPSKAISVIIDKFEAEMN